ncbi:hypothetical protein V8F20_004220 [Naviculisporaceae sp. PSN 640]
MGAIIRGVIGAVVGLTLLATALICYILAQRRKRLELQKLKEEARLATSSRISLMSSPNHPAGLDGDAAADNFGVEPGGSRTYLNGFVSGTVLGTRYARTSVG